MKNFVFSGSVTINFLPLKIVYEDFV